MTAHADVTWMPVTVPFTTVLPEPVANRVETVSGSILPRWLRDIAERDQHGYAVIAGNGHPVAILYIDRVPVAATLLNMAHSEEPFAVIRALGAHAAVELVVVTYRFSVEVARATTGLFWSPRRQIVLGDPEREIAELLRELAASQFTGAIQFRTDEAHWGVLLFHNGRFVSSFDNDDRALKGMLDQALVACHRPGTIVVICPSRVVHKLDEALLGAETSAGEVRRDEMVFEVETVLITVFSELEHRLTKASSEVERLPGTVAESLARSYLDVTDVPRAVIGQQRRAPTLHPLLARHWDATRNRLDVDTLLSTLHLATIPEVWPVAADALASAVEDEINPLLDWLALDDTASAQSLRDTLTELLQQSRALVRRWRDVHFS